MPLSYLDSDADILRMLKEVNGIYVPGDSHKAIANKRYQQAFTTVLDYVKKANARNIRYTNDDIIEAYLATQEK